jgi:VIT1/CCC1 family predicted Fe2+/Mn2+ transporter
MTVRISTRARPRPVEPGLFDRLLDPIDRLAATIFSVLVVLGFTLAYRVLRLDAGQTADYASRLFFAALGAAFAGGIIDGIMYALLGLFARGEKHRLLGELKSAETPDEGIEIIADELDEILEPITREERRQELYVDVLEHLVDSQPQPVRLTREDALGAVGCVVVAVLAVLPSLAPLLILRYDPSLAIRASNIVSFVVLFVTGYQWGRYAGANPWKTGATVAATSAVMVAIAIPLGG